MLLTWGGYMDYKGGHGGAVRKISGADQELFE